VREEVRGVISINFQKMAGTVASRTLSVGTELVEILSFISPGTVLSSSCCGTLFVFAKVLDISACSKVTPVFSEREDDVTRSFTTVGHCE
jgi:hypothetical protein